MIVCNIYQLSGNSGAPLWVIDTCRTDDSNEKWALISSACLRNSGTPTTRSQFPWQQWSADDERHEKKQQRRRKKRRTQRLWRFLLPTKNGAIGKERQQECTRGCFDAGERRRTACLLDVACRREETQSGTGRCEILVLFVNKEGSWKSRQQGPQAPVLAQRK